MDGENERGGSSRHHRRLEGEKENYHEKQSRRVGVIFRVNIQFDLTSHDLECVVILSRPARLKMTDELDYRVC